MAQFVTEGGKVWVEGHEMIATNVTSRNGVIRFRGICTGHASNDPIRNTGYNGGTYGSNEGATYTTRNVGAVHE